eukprot:CAMPEP_0185837566 /NCGR_PEP_ID=MMETSP1353-20130828/11616_1 /TAXON_ID=1077150 /ORGANISM="Erythrolobus australicus, Strain CCMP3124" /LENGTH=36 /DNA_ID= /DNA_START= /DNA_END= /DNA_ORIENTATION=
MILYVRKTLPGAELQRALYDFAPALTIMLVLEPRVV